MFEQYQAKAKATHNPYCPAYKPAGQVDAETSKDNAEKNLHVVSEAHIDHPVGEAVKDIEDLGFGKLVRELDIDGRTFRFVFAPTKPFDGQIQIKVSYQHKEEDKPGENPPEGQDLDIGPAKEKSSPESEFVIAELEMGNVSHFAELVKRVTDGKVEYFAFRPDQDGSGKKRATISIEW